MSPDEKIHRRHFYACLPVLSLMRMFTAFMLESIKKIKGVCYDPSVRM